MESLERREGYSSSTRCAAERFCRGKTRRFKSNREVLRAAQILFDLRREMTMQQDKNSHKELLCLEKAVSANLHKTIEASPVKISIVSAFKQQRLSKMEREIVLFLALSAFGMARFRGRRRPDFFGLDEIQNVVLTQSRDNLAIARAFTEGSRLVSSGIVSTCGEGFPVGIGILVSNEFLVKVLADGRFSSNGWKVRTYDGLLDKTYLIVRTLYERSINISLGARDNPFPWRPMPRFDADTGDFQLRRNMEVLTETLERHRNWPLSGVLSEVRTREEKLVILALLGKELGFFPSTNTLFTGRGLVFAVSKDVPSMRHNINLLKSSHCLRADGYIQIRGGPDDNPTLEDEDVLKDCVFELTEKLVQRLKIGRKRKSNHSARDPQMTMEQLVLCPETTEALSLAEAQIRHSNVFLKEWGLGIRFPYGKGAILLFWGPPGVGKTAAAEALAHKLSKRIIVVNYAEIQNCWVGQTEKNIVQIFREARDADAVLFWDEADAMFYDRDSALRNWEVRDVNVLLQELERFSGVCILSTNRQVTLDKALERRIAIKVQFCKPDKEMALQIWRKIVPKEMPLTNDVDFEELADADMTGGEIKNVLLNAARFALSRGGKSKVTMTDFRNAIEIEKSGRWSQKNRLVGFVKK